MKRPIVPGHELAGEVVEVGSSVRDVAVGDRVVNLHVAPCGQCRYCVAGHHPRCERAMHNLGLTADGAYAEYALLQERAVVPLPDGIAFEQGCFLACTAAVALRALVTRGGLVAGEHVLITGASGGLGLHGIQVAKALNAEVTAVTSSEKKADTLRAMGADHVIVATDGKFHGEVVASTNGGVDLVMDTVGVPTLNSAIRSVRTMGRVVVIGNVTIERAQLNPGLFILKELTLTGSSGCSKDDLLKVLDWVKDGTVKPVIDRVLPLDDAVEAHRCLEQRGVMGRIVLTP